jgi:transposase
MSECGFAFLKHRLYLASSVSRKKPERIVALRCVMALCLLVYRLAEHRLRQELVTTSQTLHNQVRKPTTRPAMRWVFRCIEGIDRLTIQTPGGEPVLALRLRSLRE